MTTSTFPATLQAEVATLQAQHPILAGALDKAFALVASGAVFPLEDGHTAHVRSQSDPTVSHLVNGTCDCKATQYHAAPCAHRLAFRVYQRTALRLTGEEAEERWEPVEASEPAPAPLPEAPVSINVRVTVQGRDCQVTLRGMDELEVLARLERLLARFPLPQAPQPAQPLSPQQHHAAAMPRPTEGFCAVHNVQMIENEKNGQRWWSHRLAEGGFCKGRRSPVT